jgi:hypothetical protein
MFVGHDCYHQNNIVMLVIINTIITKFVIIKTIYNHLCHWGLILNNLPLFDDDKQFDVYTNKLPLNICLG